MIEVSRDSNFEIIEQEFEEDYIHMMISSKPNHSVLSLIRRIKSMSTIRTWKRFSQILKKYYWKENTLWSDSYFACTIGNASIKTIRKYIQEQ
jgi:putative transposase